MDDAKETRKEGRKRETPGYVRDFEVHRVQPKQLPGLRHQGRVESHLRPNQGHLRIGVEEDGEDRPEENTGVFPITAPSCGCRLNYRPISKTRRCRPATASRRRASRQSTTSPGPTTASGTSWMISAPPCGCSSYYEAISGPTSDSAHKVPAAQL